MDQVYLVEFRCYAKRHRKPQSKLVMAASAYWRATSWVEKSPAARAIERDSGAKVWWWAITSVDLDGEINLHTELLTCNQNGYWVFAPWAPDDKGNYFPERICGTCIYNDDCGWAGQADQLDLYPFCESRDEKRACSEFHAATPKGERCLFIGAKFPCEKCGEPIAQHVEK